MTLYLLDYGAGNVRSLANSLNHLGYDFKWIASPDDFDKASRLIFPGVGAFKSAIEHLTSRGFLDPLKRYIASGRSYFGICIGLQILYESSAENPGVNGLGIIPCAIERFDHEDKTVPHMGWNTIEFLDGPEGNTVGMDQSSHYYFVHSYRAAYDPANAETARWAHATTQYGEEEFVATVLKGNVFATQFHPEKSGQAGLRILDTWLKKPVQDPVSGAPPQRGERKPRPYDGFTKRIIACMDVRTNDEGDLVVTKGDRYDVREKVSDTTMKATTAGAVRNLGKPVTLAQKYYEEGADEIAFLNITSFRHSPLHDQPMLEVLKAAAENIFVPLTIGGGIKHTVDPDGTHRSALEVAGEYFRAGADKVSIGSEAVHAVEKMLANGGSGDGTSAIETIAEAYGKQAVVVSVDPKRVYVDPASYDGPHIDELIHGEEGEEAGKAWWYQCTVHGGREARDMGVLQLAKGVEALGAGEILLNCIDRDGTGLGFDVELIGLVAAAVDIPVIASSGAGKPEHFVEVFDDTGVDAALAAGIFHRGDVRIQEVKDALHAAQIAARKS